jgi:diguanylate cyclase (GGDEF)-like protein
LCAKIELGCVIRVLPARAERVPSRMPKAPAHQTRTVLLIVASGVAVAAAGFRLRQLPFIADPWMCASIDTIGAFLSFTFAANTLVRFSGTRERMALLLAAGFGISGLMQLSLALQLFSHASSASELVNSLRISWMQSSMLLAEAMLLAAAFASPPPQAHEPNQKDLALLALAGTMAYASGALYFLVSPEPDIHAGTTVPRLWQLLPAALYLLAAVAFQRRVQRASSHLEKSLTLMAWINFASHLVLLESVQALDAPFTFAQTLRVSSYAVVLGGALLDNSRLFQQVQHLAASDPLTGLANYRRLVDVLETEIERSGRTGREFSILLLDLDGLKAINDRWGHLTGSRALCRLAETLRVHSRSVDTAARYGGDEFALVLPETGELAARRVAARIRERLASQTEQPKISASIGVAVYPNSGPTAERLLMAADEALYAMKQKVTGQSVGRD